MPQKTKKQKRHADQYRKGAVEVAISSPMPQRTAEPIQVTGGVFSFQRTTVTQKPINHSLLLDEKELVEVRKDLLQTIFLAACIIAVEIALAFYLHR